MTIVRIWCLGADDFVLYRSGPLRREGGEYFTKAALRAFLQELGELRQTRVFVQKARAGNFLRYVIDDALQRPPCDCATDVVAGG